MGYAVIDEDKLNQLLEGMEELKGTVIELSSKINPEPAPDKLFTIKQIVKAGGGSYSRVAEKIRNSKVTPQKISGKIAITYAEIKELGITINPFDIK